MLTPGNNRKLTSCILILLCTYEKICFLNDIEHRQGQRADQDESNLYPRDFHGTSGHKSRSQGSSYAEAECRNSGILASALHLSASQK